MNVTHSEQSPKIVFADNNERSRRYEPLQTSYHNQLFDLVKDKDYFVLTTNVDHCFQKAGFDKKRLFYTQGDYGLIQCSQPCGQDTYDNETMVRQMLESQGFVIGDDGGLTVPEGVTSEMTVPTELVPLCPKCGRPMMVSLRSDNTFVEDEGGTWPQSGMQLSSTATRA
jgi:NAD-dependent SIR2 family protein deacetylase